jgi:3-isopropylmalate/(R)-2-methylmalate dehydratase large subunit
MGMTITEKILAAHSRFETVKPGDIIDVFIDVRVARDFGGANVVKHMEENNLSIDDSARTLFTFDCNPTGSDQKYAANQHFCRLYARKNNIRVYDINKGIGTHILIEEGLAYPGVTAISTDSHANILGSVGAFGQGMGDLDIAVSWAKGKVWFKVPESVKLVLTGKLQERVSAKDIILNLLAHFGANKLLGYAVEIYGDIVEKFSLDERITISSMATELGAIIIIFPPDKEVMRYCESRSGRKIPELRADEDALYKEIYTVDVSEFTSMVSMPGKPHNSVKIDMVSRTKIDSAFIGSCTNGRIEDMKAAAQILRGRKVAPGVVLKIVPSTDLVWQRCLDEGLIEIFKESGALISNAGCAGCAAGQVGQNGPGEVSISTGNRNFPGKQGRGEVFLASPEVVAASSIAGFITSPDKIPEKPAIFDSAILNEAKSIRTKPERCINSQPEFISGRTWYIGMDDIDTDMIFHNRYLTITDIHEMGKFTFDNLPGFEDFAKKAKPGDIVVAGKNFGAGSSRQQAVDCFTSLGILCIIAESFGSIYERNAINAAFPIITCPEIKKIGLQNGDDLRVNFASGSISNIRNGLSVKGNGFSDVQMEIYRNGGLF